jgi:hypothetical protein
MLKVCYIFIYGFAAHSAVGKFSIGVLFQGCVYKSSPELLSKLYPQLFIIGAIGWSNTIQHIPIAL